MAKQKPNIVFILTDDQSYGYMGVTGNKIAKTPNIDKIANQGVLYTNAHISSAICTPSRISTLLSQYERKHGVNFNSGTAVSEEAWQDSYPVVMRRAGYYTGWVGKNHSPIGRGGYKSGVMEKSFDYWWAGHGHIKFYPKEIHKIFKSAKNDTQLEIVTEGIDDFLDSNETRIDTAIRFIENRPENKPFMLSVNLNLPHSAGIRTMELRDTDNTLYKTAYRDQTMPLPEHYVARKDITEPKLPSSIFRVSDRQTNYNYVDTPDTLREFYTRQMQAMTGIDRLVGNLRNKLAQLQLDKNTIIIFSSDHGLFIGQHGLGGKALCYEKTTHVPLIIFDPRLDKKHRGQRRDDLVQSIDIAPTMLSLAGLELPVSYQGEDISPLLSDKNISVKRKYVFSENLWSNHYGNPRCDAIQTKKWKYIRYYQNNTFSAAKYFKTAKMLGVPVSTFLKPHDSDIALYRDYIERPLRGESPVYEELYHLDSDPQELVNLIDSKAHLNILSEMRSDADQTLKYARGSGLPKVVRNTYDSELALPKKNKKKNKNKIR